MAGPLADRVSWFVQRLRRLMLLALSAALLCITYAMLSLPLPGAAASHPPPFTWATVPATGVAIALIGLFLGVTFPLYRDHTHTPQLNVLYFAPPLAILRRVCAPLGLCVLLCVAVPWHAQVLRTGRGADLPSS